MVYGPPSPRQAYVCPVDPSSKIQYLLVLTIIWDALDCCGRMMLVSYKKSFSKSVSCELD